MPEPRTTLDLTTAQVPFIAKSGPAAADQFLATRDDVEEYKGTDGDVQLAFDATNRSYRAKKNGNFVDFDGVDLSNRLVLVERFHRRPALNNVLDTYTASVAAAEAVATNVANVDFEVAGTNMTTALATFNAEGGVLLTTAGANNDQAILQPHTSTNQSAWTAYTWGTDQETRWECVVRTAASVAAIRLWAGLKLTDTGVTATDDDQVFFKFDTGHATITTKWIAVASIGGTDVETDSGVTVSANTAYHLVVNIDSSRIAKFYVNGALVYTSGALTNATDLIPYAGVHALTGAAKAMTVRWIKCSRKYA